MKVLSRNKTSAFSSRGSSQASNNVMGLHHLNGSNQRDTNSKLNKSLRGIGLPTGLKQKKADKVAEAQMGYHLQNIMRQEIRRHRLYNERPPSPDETEASYSSSSGSEGFWDDDKKWGLFGGCGGGDNESYADSIESDEQSEATPVPIMPSAATGLGCRGKMLKQNNKTGKVEEPQPRYPAPLVDAMCKEINRHRGDYATTSPDEDDNSFYSGSQVSEDNSDEASYDDGDCAPFGGCGDDDNDSFKSEVSDEIDIASVEEQTVTGAPIGIPGLCGISDWLFAADYDNQSMAPDDAKKRDTNLKRTKELQNHHGQLDICGRSPESLKLRKYSQPPHPESPDHILVKVQASTVSVQDFIGKVSDDNDRRVPGRQIVGEVCRLGKKVSKKKDINLGDRVAALTPEGKGNARYISIPANSAIYIPPDIERDNAICLIGSYIQAYQMLNLGRTSRIPFTDSNVLIIGGSHPVGQAMVELALREGAHVFATADKSHRDYLEKKGATWFPNNPKKLYKLRKRMDVVVDTLCMDGYNSSYQALNGQGKLVCTSNPPIRDRGFIFSRISRAWTEFNARYVWPDVAFYDVNEAFQDDPRMFEHEFRYLLCKLRNKEINPKISGKVALNQVPKAQKLLERDLPNGTIIVLPWEKLDPTQNVPVEDVQ